MPCRTCARDGRRVVAHLTDDEAVSLGINTRADLALVQEQARRGLLEQHMLAGVTIADPSSTWIDAGVRVGEDTTIEPFTMLRGHTEVGGGCTIGPGSTLVDCVVGDGSSVLHSYLDRLRGAQPLHGGTVHPHPPRHRAAGRLEGRVLRRDQELGHR